MKLSRTSILALALAAGSFASAADFGLQLNVGIPQNDWKTSVGSGTGLGLGVFLDVPVKGGHVLRPRLDYITFPEQTESDYPYPDLHHTWSTRSLGVDYLFYPAGERKGIYLAAGLAARQFHVSADSGGPSDSWDTTRLGISLGAGYALNTTWELNLRYTQTKIQESTLGEIDLGVAYRF